MSNGGHSDIGPELRRLAQTILDGIDPAVRAAISAEVTGWVARYRDHPAVRMWALGNETFHKLVPPAWCRERPTATQAARARASRRKRQRARRWPGPTTGKLRASGLHVRG